MLRSSDDKAQPDDGDAAQPDDDDTPQAGTPPAGGGLSSGGTEGGFIDDPTSSGGSGPETGSGRAKGDAACGIASAKSELQPLALAFAFDVSGSMGKGDEPYHDRGLKWDPVVAATKAFFGDDSVSGVTASLAFFPLEEERCERENYLTPAVPLQPVPSMAFSDAIDAVTPKTDDDWRGGTPTLAVLGGTIDYVQGLIDGGSVAKHAIVLVTDGAPQGCSEEENDIQAVAALAAGVRATIPTYVIGVANPSTEKEPDPPDTVSNLNLVAEQGGTGQAFLIDTGNPAKTSTDFLDVVATIRGQGLSCALAIPDPPPGSTFDPHRVNVSSSTATGSIPLGYSGDCGAANSWRFDNETTPTAIELCPDTCASVQAESDASLDVEFGCVRRIAEAR